MSTIIKTGFILLLLLGASIHFGIFTSANKDNLKAFANASQFEDNSMYFILRGSDTKLGGFARQYNKTNEFATHVALGIYRDSLQIFHANTEAQNGQHILSENLNDFITREKDQYTYLAYWKIDTISSEEIDAVLAEIAKLQTEEIKFDYKFNFESDDKLYCSEFIYKVINKATQQKFEISMTTMAVPEEHHFYLKKDSLVFYPSDFFLDYDGISFMSEWKLEAVQ